MDSVNHAERQDDSYPLDEMIITDYGGMKCQEETEQGLKDMAQ